MKSFLLLMVSLITGLQVSTDDKLQVMGCREGSVEFTCAYPKPNRPYERTAVVVENSKKHIQSSQKDVWKTKDGLSLYHDTKNKELKVAIKQLNNPGEYECKFYPKARSSDDEQEVKVTTDRHGCQQSFHQTAYSEAKTTITCHYPGNTLMSGVKFFCKENDSTCEEILSTKSSPNSKGTFSLTETNSGFNVSISHVSSQDAGVYWCGVKSNDGSYRVSIRKIHLEVEDITTVTRSLTVGQNFTYLCEYPNSVPIKKFVCKGEDPSICEPLANTQQHNNKNTRFSMKENSKKTNSTITMREVTTDDSGTYWCGADSTNERRSNPFFNRLLMTVVPSTTMTPSIMSATSHHPLATTSTAQHGGSSLFNVIIPAVACVAVLVLLLILVLVYKRFQRSKNIRNREALNKDDHAYEEMQERSHKPDSGTALKTIYVTANLPTNPSPDSHHDNISFQNSSGKVDTYSTVTDNGQHPIYSTVDHPPRFSEDPFYSTVNHPQQH